MNEGKGLSKITDGFKDVALVLPGLSGSNSKGGGSESGNIADANGVEVLNDAENSAKEGGFYRPTVNGKAGGKVATATGAVAGGKSGSMVGIKGKGGFKVGASLAIVAVGFIGIIVMMIGAPMFMIETIDLNLQGATNFTKDKETLEAQTTHVLAESLKNGRMPNDLSEDLAMNGVDVGQITLMGGFVRTNTYIANIDELDEVAAEGNYNVNSGGGELVFRFEDQIITASELVATMDLNSRLYIAVEKGADISARYYYSKDVDEVYRDMGLSRNNFSGWENTGNSKEDQENFSEILSNMLDDDPSLIVNGCEEVKISGDDGVENSECGGGSFDMKVSGSDDASAIVSEVGRQTTGDNSTEKAAQLLNTAISSGEPYRAASAFMAVEEPIQRARIDGDGPVNELMNTLNRSTEITYTDIETGETVTDRTSIMNTKNFTAAVSGGSYSKSEAANFSRDRVLKVTNIDDDSVVENTSVASDWRSKSSSVVDISSGDAADKDVLSKATDSVNIALVQSNSEQFTSVVGGNRIVEGGLFLNDTIGKRTLGKMASDVETIANYNHKIEEIAARKAKAEREVLSPFDISSSNTFLGSLVHSLGAVMLRGRGGIFTSTASAVANTTSSSVAKILGIASADGEDGNNFGDCETVKIAGDVEGDLWCTEYGTINTDRMSNTLKDWIEELGPDNIDEDGRIKKGSDLERFIILGMDREVTVGVKSADVCERWKSSGGQDVGGALLDVLSSIFGTYESCSSVSDDIALGTRYTLSSSNVNVSDVEKYSGYVLYDTVVSLLNEKESSVATLREEYYKEHPKDNSVAGRLARRSGMSKEEAQVALNYASYLDKIARYDASTRYAFGEPVFKMEKKDLLVEHSDTVQVSLYCIWCGKTEYADVRNRSFVA